MNLSKYIASYFLAHLLVLPLATSSAEGASNHTQTHKSSPTQLSLASNSTGQATFVAPAPSTTGATLFAAYDFNQYQAPRMQKSSQEPQKSKESTSPAQDTPSKNSPQEKVKKDKNPTAQATDKPEVEKQEQDSQHPSQWNKKRGTTRLYIRRDEQPENPKDKPNQTKKEDNKKLEKKPVNKPADGPKVEKQEQDPQHPNQWNKKRPSTTFYIQKDKQSGSPQESTSPYQRQPEDNKSNTNKTNQTKKPDNKKSGNKKPTDKPEDKPKVEQQKQDPQHPSQWNKKRPSTTFHIQKDKQSGSPKESTSPYQRQPEDNKSNTNKTNQTKKPDSKKPDSKKPTDNKPGDRPEVEQQKKTPLHPSQRNKKRPGTTFYIQKDAQPEGSKGITGPPHTSSKKDVAGPGKKQELPSPKPPVKKEATNEPPTPPKKVEAKTRIKLDTGEKELVMPEGVPKATLEKELAQAYALFDSRYIASLGKTKEELEEHWGFPLQVMGEQGTGEQVVGFRYKGTILRPNEIDDDKKKKKKKDSSQDYYYSKSIGRSADKSFACLVVLWVDKKGEGVVVDGDAVGDCFIPEALDQLPVRFERE